jgi:hypothetical protein
MDINNIYGLIEEIKFDKDPAQSKYLHIYGALPYVVSHACARANLRWCQYALDKGANVNGEWTPAIQPKDMNFKTPLMRAVSGASLECVRLLCKRGANLDAQFGFERNTALQIAINQKSHDMVALLLELGADARGEHDLPYITRAARVSTQMVELFLDHGISSELIDPRVWTSEIGTMVQRRKECKTAARLVYQVLRKRYRVPVLGFQGGGYKLPKEIANQIARYVWGSRASEEWNNLW